AKIADVGTDHRRLAQSDRVAHIRTVHRAERTAHNREVRQGVSGPQFAERVKHKQRHAVPHTASRSVVRATYDTAKALTEVRIEFRSNRIEPFRLPRRNENLRRPPARTRLNPRQLLHENLLLARPRRTAHDQRPL